MQVLVFKVYQNSPLKLRDFFLGVYRVIGFRV